MINTSKKILNWFLVVVLVMGFGEVSGKGIKPLKITGEEIGVLPIAPGITPVGPVTFCKGGYLVVSGANNNSTYQWQVGGNNIPNATNDSLFVTSSGTYTCVVTNGGNSNTLDNVVVTVEAISISATSTSICNGSSTTLTASGSTTGTYTWITPPATSGAAITVSPTSNTTYSVWSNINSCRDTASITIIVKPNPAIPTITATPTTICSGGSISFSTPAIAGQTFSWDYGDGTTDGTGTSVNHTYNLASTGNGSTNFTVTLTTTISATGCKNTKTQVVTIGQSPDATLSDANYDPAVAPPFVNCASTSSSIYNLTVQNSSATSSSNSNYVIKWGDNSAPYSSSTFTGNITHTYPALGSYNLWFIVTGSNGCKDSTRYQVYFGSTPEGGFVPQSGTVGCEGSTFIFYPDATAFNNPPSSNYLIWFSDGTDTLRFTQATLPTSFTHTFDSSSCGQTNNVWKIRWYISNPCGAYDGNNAAIKITKKSKANFTILPYDTICINSTIRVNNTSDLGLIPTGTPTICIPGKFRWTITPNTGYTLATGEVLGNTSTDGSNNLNITFNTVGTYSISLFTGSGCGADTMTKTICVNPKPTASFTLNRDTICPSQSIFATGSTNTPTCGQNTYQYSVAYISTPGCTPSASDYSYIDNTSSTSQNPHFQFVSPGQYIISLQTIAPNNRCQSVIFKDTITVKGKPVVSINLSNSAICVNQTISPSNISTCYIDPSTTYSWSFPNGTPTTSTSSNPGAITYNNSGTNNITLNVTNICGTTPASATVTINPLPTVTGTFSVCVGQNTTLTGTSTSTGSGTWTSSNTGIVTVINSGVVTGVAAGTSIITFTDGNGCQKAITVTVNPLPTITGNAAICVGSALTLTGSATAATTNPWVSATTGVATITNAGVVTAVSSGTSVITYTNSNGCKIDETFTVNPLPTISGTTTICLNNTSQLTGSGTAAATNPWTSSATSVATVSISGLVTTLSVGTTTITYTNNNGCAKTTTVTVKPLPIITGSSSICVGSNVSFSATTNPSTSTPWSSSNTNAATVSSSGAVVGIAAGTSTITYTNEFGCQATLLVTVSSSPNATITYPSAVCTNQTNQNVTLTGATGGTFSISPIGTTGLSLNTSNGSVNPSTSTAGTYTVNYNIPAGNGCSAVNVNTSLTITNTPLAPTVTSPVVYCQNVTASALTATASGTNSLLFYNTSTGGTGSTSLTPSTSSAGSTTYYVSQVTVNGCEGPRTSITVTVNPLPTITGNSALCVGSTLSLTGSATVATTNPWVSATTSVATVTNAGVVTAVSAGISVITYTNSNGCKFDETITVNPLPTITGDTIICLNNTSQLTGSATAASTNPWVSATTSVAAVSAGGLVTASSLGTSIITYTNTNGCNKKVTVIVKPLPVITGSSSICVGSNVGFSATTNPSTTTPWSSSNTNVATVNNSGTVVGVAAGITTITYTNEFGCQDTFSVTVSSSPTATISYPSTVCTNQTNQNVTLTGATGGTFSISPVGTIGLSLNTNTGSVNPSTSTAGTYTVNYNIPAGNGCPAVNIDTAITITTTPSAPVPSGNNICSGNTLQLNTSYTGSGTPTWSWTGPNSFSSSDEDPSISNVTVAATGTYNLTLTINGCTSPAGTLNVVVNQTPATPTPSSNTPVCTGNALTLTASTSSTMPVTWSWSGPASFTSTQQNPTVSATATTAMAGTYNVTATASYTTTTTLNCPSATASTIVVVNPTPAINSSSFTNPTNCASSTGTIILNGLTASTPYTVNYTNSSGAQTSTITSSSGGVITIPLLPAGTYSNVFVVLSNCPSAPVGPFSLVDPNPPPAPSATNNSAICDGESLQLNATTNEPGTPTWNWTGPNSYSSTLQNPQITSATLINAGTYNVTVTINSCTSPAGATTVIVNPRPAVPIVNSPVIYCQNIVPVALTATALPGHTLTWYTSSTGGTGSAIAPIPSTTTVGTVSYFVSQTTPANCEGPRAQIDVIVNPTPVVSNQSQTICSGASFTISPSGTSSVPSNTFYSWGLPVVTGGLTGGATGTSQSNITGTLFNPTDFVHTATYTVTSISGSCPGNTFTVVISVNPAPRIIFSLANQSICSGDISQAVTLTSPTPGAIIPWTSTQPTGINGVTLSGSGTIPAQTLINTTPNPITVTYTATASTTGTSACPGTPTPYQVVVTPTPVIPNTTETICSGGFFNVQPANSTTTIVPSGTTYTWTVSSNSNITGQANQTIAQTEIADTLTNISNVPQTIVYTVTPKSGIADSCVGQTFTITVTVNPKPVIPTLTQTVCSGNAFLLNPINGQPNANTIVPNATVYNWSAPTLPVGMSGAASGTNQTTISGTLLNTTFAPITITYVVTPTSGAAGTCVGSPFNVDITVNPLASISNNPLNQSVCNGNTTLSVNWSSFTAGSTYAWTLVSFGNVTGYQTAGNGPTLVAMTLSNTGIAQDSVVYAVSSTASACAGPATNYTIYVNPDAKADYTYPYDTACWPYAIVINNTSPRSPGNINIPNSSYNWYTINQLGTETLIGTGSIFPGYSIPGPSDSIKIKMVSISAFGCKNDSLTHTFFTKPKPTAAFTMSNRDSCGPLTISFVNQTNIRDTFRYQWNFGNGQTSTATNPAPVTYLSNPRFFDTTYYITLRAFNECDTTTYVDSVIVRADPKARFSVSSSSGCSPFTIQIINSSLGNPHTYYWDFGDGTPILTTTTLGSLSHTYYTGVVDTFELKLVAISACGSDTQKIKIRVAPNVIIPGVSVTATELYGCVSHSVNFNNTSTGATNFIWDFGDGTPLQPTNFFQTIVNHTYNTAGTFNVLINMTNGCSDTSINTSITVYPRPTAAFTTSQTVYCLGDTTRFINNSINATNYTWNIGNGVFNTNFQPNYLYLNPGVYNIQLEAQQSNATGLVCFDTITRSITILSKPDTAIITNIRPVNCSPFIITGSVPGYTTESITWYVYDTTLPIYPVVISNPILNYTFNNSGRFKVVMVIENASGCKDSTFRFLSVYAKPVAGFTPLNLATCSLDTLVSYINNTTANIYTPLTYRWYVDGIQRATSGNLTYRYTALPTDILPRIFNTKLVAINSVGCADSITGALQISPTSKSIFTLSNPQACIPFVAAINNSSTYATNYQWYLNGVLVSTDENPIINITRANTSYTVTLIVSNIYACRPDTSSYTFRTRVMPIAAFSFNDTLGCTGQLAVVTTNTSQHANAYTWQWGDASPNSTLFNPTHLFTSVGNFNTTLTASDGVCTDTVSHAVVVSQKPTANFIANNVKNCDTSGVRFINLTANATSFIWTVSNGFTTTETSPTITLPPSATSYSVTLLAINADGCRDSLTRANYIKVYALPPADFTITPSSTIYIPNYTFGFLNLTPDNPMYKYNWSLGDGTFAITRDVVSHLYNDTGNYEVRLTVLDTTTSCVDTVIKYARILGNPGYLYVPNAFYANSTQLNFKYFKPLGKGLAEYELLIFDSWGKLLFRTTKLDYAGSPVDGWDGTFKGAPMPQDAYAWKIKARFRNGKVWEGMNYDQSQQKQPAHSFGTLTLFR